MLNLNDREWSDFVLGDLFDSYTGTDLIIGKITKGEIPVISHAATNNGIACYSAVIERRQIFSHNNTISLADRGNFKAFVQKTDFYIGTRVKALVAKNVFSKKALMFIANSIDKQAVKFSYGYNACDNIDKLHIMLPTADNGQPDYAFMEQYIGEREDKLKQKYIDFVNAELETPPIPLAEKTWKAFFISDICDIESGRDIYDAERVEGDIPYITSTAANNGIKYYVSNTNETLEENAISVNRNGSVGYSFYHKYKALYSNDCRKLKLKQCRNEFVALFITNQITQQKDKYNYGYKMGTGRLKRQRIMLPITDDGQPDYAFMEQYIKAVMFGKYKKYLEYAHSPVL